MTTFNNSSSSMSISLSQVASASVMSSKASLGAPNANSTGNTASDPYTMKKGVFACSARLG
jgi:hypothetical protein